MEKIMCDCGHLESDHGEITRGYGTDGNGKTMCYACCEADDKSRLLADNGFLGYISSDGKNLVGWPGWVLGTVVKWGGRHSWSRERHYITVRDCHGQLWHGTGAEGMWARLRKCRAV